MRADAKAKWVEALRSGGFKQGASTLKTVDGNYCCLGVLCHVMADEIRTVTTLEESDLGIQLQYDGYRTKLPPSVLDLFEITHDQQSDLMKRNDGAGEYVISQSFNEIADHIEATM